MNIQNCYWINIWTVYRKENKWIHKRWTFEESDTVQILKVCRLSGLILMCLRFQGLRRYEAIDKESARKTVIVASNLESVEP